MSTSRYYFEIYRDGTPVRRWRWRLKAGNGENVANGGEGYSTKQACEMAVERIRENAGNADIRYV